jgi:hypothetical protein
MKKIKINSINTHLGVKVPNYQYTYRNMYKGTQARGLGELSNTDSKVSLRVPSDIFSKLQLNRHLGHEPFFRWQ